MLTRFVMNQMAWVVFPLVGVSLLAIGCLLAVMHHFLHINDYPAFVLGCETQGLDRATCRGLADAKYGKQ